jgi:glycosyltransferase involved in cell wall biosynthesis
MPSVKIAIDIRRMTEFGVGTYIRNVVRTLGRLDHETTYVLIGSPAKVKEIGPLPPNFHTVALAEPERSLMGYREFRGVVRRLDCDLVHIPNLFSIPRGLSCPYVMTVHDILEHLSRAREQTGIWRSLHFQLTKRVLSGAARIFAVSNFTKLEIEKLFNIPPGRIEVVYNAIDERLLHGHARPGPPVDRRALSGDLSFSALCRKNQPAQERRAHDRGFLRAENGTGKRSLVSRSEADHYRR